MRSDSPTRVRVEPFSLPLASPIGTAQGVLENRSGFVVIVEFGPDDGADGDLTGIRGVGEATPLPGWTESRSACADALADCVRNPPAYIDTSSGANAGGWVPDSSDIGGRRDSPDVPAARHGIVLALADAAGKSAGESVATRLAATAGFPSPASRVPLNATIGDGPPVETATAAERAVEQGYTSVKVKVGARDLDSDLDRLRAVDDAVGSTIRLRLDANGGWDRATANRAFEHVQRYDVEYVEQPLPAADLAGLRGLRDRFDVPVAADESVVTCGIPAVLNGDAADVVVLKPMALGGVDRAVDAARRARAVDVDPVVTTTIDGVVARTAAVHVAAAIPDVRPCGLATGSLLAADIAPDPCTIDDGWISVPPDDGLAGRAFDDIASGDS